MEKHNFVYSAPDTCKCGDSRKSISHFEQPIEYRFFEWLESRPTRHGVITLSMEEVKEMRDYFIKRVAEKDALGG